LRISNFSINLSNQEKLSHFLRKIYHAVDVKIAQIESIIKSYIVSVTHNLLSHCEDISHKFLAFCQFTQKNESSPNSNISQSAHIVNAKQNEKIKIIRIGALNFQDL
jgi:negative regulator of replication initiation